MAAGGWGRGGWRLRGVSGSAGARVSSALKVGRRRGGDVSRRALRERISSMQMREEKQM